MIEHQVATGDGRVLQVREDGHRGGRAVLVHNGSPNSRLLYGPEVERAQRHGIRLISYDRPGYGGSTPHRGRSIADCAADVRAIAAALELDQLPTWGISGGGPHAIACAALLEDLVPAVGVLASCAPWEAEGLDFFAGMGELNVEDTRLMLADPAAARAKLERERQEMLEMSADALLEYMNTLLSPVDAEAASGELAQHMVDSARSGLGPGSDGWWDDEVAFLSDWGFELGSIRTPVLLLHGRQDRFVPFTHGEWLSHHIPGVEAELSEEDGHLTLTRRHLDDVYVWLFEHVG